MDLPRLLGEEDDGLPRRIAAPDHDGLLASAEPRLHLGGGVVDPGALEFAEPRHVEPAVLHAAGDQDAPGAEPGPVHQGDDPVAPVEPQRAHPAGHGDPGPEPLRLHQGVAGQLGPGDPGRESQVVLDPRAGAGLPAGRDRLGREHVESLGGRVDRGRQSGRPGAHHDDVVDVLLAQCLGEPGAAGELFQRGPAVELPFPPHYERRRRRRYLELPQDRLGLAVGLQVEPLEGDQVPGGEVAEAVRLGREARADDGHADHATPEQQLPAHDERLDHRLAQIGHLVHRVPQLLGVEREDPAVLQHPPHDDDAPAGQGVHVAGELADPVHRDLSLALAGVRHDLDGPLEHHEEPETPVAFAEEDLARAHGAEVTPGRQLLQLSRSEDRKGDVALGGHGVM
jgi:hypothetical protein